MAGSSSSLSTRYVDTLDKVHRDRYLDKLSIVNGLDPYELKGEWSQEPELFPCVSYPDIVNYLIFNKSFYTSEDMKAWKSLDAYNQLTSGWISDVAVVVKNPYCIVKAKVLHSQRLREKPLAPWVICKKSGEVCTAHCNCMAGLGEVCSHVATLLFAVDATVRIRDSKTVTEQPAYWMLPSQMKIVSYKPVGEIDFTSAGMKRRNLESVIATGTPIAQKHRESKKIEPPSDEQFNNFIHALSLGPTKPAILSLLSPYNEAFIPKESQDAFPTDLSNLFDSVLYEKPYNDVLAAAKSVTLTISDQQVLSTELATREQSKSKLWQRYRAGRITASRFHSVCATDPSQPSPSLIKNICFPTRHWGVQNEKKAKDVYFTSMENEHTNFKMRDSGLYIWKDYPQIAASPDAIVVCDCCGEGCLEVKCPYLLRDQDVQLMDVKKSEHCLVRDDQGNLTLSAKHQFYFQIQCQLFVCGLKYGDFFYWTKNSYHRERIYSNQQFWDENLPKALHIFQVGILPELLGRCTSRVPRKQQDVLSDSTNTLLSKSDVCPDTQQELFCYCRKDEFGDMIACDNQNCRFEWFHYACVGVLAEPKGKWFCPECRNLKRKSRADKRSEQN